MHRQWQQYQLITAENEGKSAASKPNAKESSASSTGLDSQEQQKRDAEVTQPEEEFPLEEFFDFDALFPTLDNPTAEELILADEHLEESPSTTQPESLDSCEGSPAEDSPPSIVFSSALFERPLKLGSPAATSQKPFLRPFPPQRQETKEPSFVLFSCYHFVSASVIWGMGQDDSRYLEQRGCLSLPEKAILDQFIQQYFLHVHPIIPIINEGDFWAMYHSQPGEAKWTGTFPLVILQAMIFVACPVSSTFQSVIKEMI